MNTWACIRFHYRLKTRATWPTETKTETYKTTCPDISVTVIPILGVSKCLETLGVFKCFETFKLRVFSQKKRKERNKRVHVNRCVRKRVGFFLVSLKNYIQK